MATKPGDPEASKEVSKAAEEMEVEDVGDVPDPDEDDLDDLDGMPSTSGPAPKEKAATAEVDALSDDDFAKQLQAGMAELMGEMESSPEMQAQFENIFKELGAAAAATGEPLSSDAAPGTGASDNPQASSSGGADASFQDTIRRTMERMQTSGDQATAAAQSEGSDDFMAELMKQMQAGGLGEGGVEGSEEEFSKMLLSMMEQLTNKDILYEPMKELNDKFPGWMEKNKDTVSEEDRKRYELQQGFVKEIVAKFEESTYSDSNAADREYIVDKMQKMQAAGSPPADLVGDMPSAQDALNAPDAESCNPQ
ncbi:Peroxisome chaperone and import receptor [Diaporthe australafricana]|uniref:Peroxisome chaperone and import receptor n=1 Tax=Diaporthe australafricana TaxID=127596 RepID=A0ABR3WPZ0_9PEZI